METQEREACGTYAAYSRHRKQGEQPCGPCLAAAATYMREFRRQNKQSTELNNARQAARSRALERLAKELPDRFQELYADEIRRIGGAR